MQEKPKFQWDYLSPIYWPTWLVMGLLYLTIFLPSSLRILFSKGIGVFLYLVWRKRRHIAKINIQTCFPNKTQQQQTELLKAHFFSVALGIFEIALAWWASPKKLASIVTIHGLENINKGLHQGKGILLVSAHFTSLDIFGAFASTAIEISAMYRKAKNPVANYIMLKGRFNRCPALFSSKEVKNLIRFLRQNNIVWYAADQNTARKESVFVTFFGETASTNMATARLSKITKAAVIPFYGKRSADAKHYDIYFEPLLDHYPQGDLHQDTQRINHIIEHWVCQIPEQYLWVHQRFRTRPNRTDPKFYE